MIKCCHDVEGPCIYCVIGSESLTDVNDTITKLLVKKAVTDQTKHVHIMGFALDQRDALLTAMHEITAYIDKNKIIPGGQECEDCNEVLTILAMAINKCIQIEKQMKS